MSIVCPTITATDAKQFKAQVEQISRFASRIHLDITDGFFAPPLLDANQIWLPEIPVDIHVMYEFPKLVLDRLVKLKPSMIIIHYESDANFNEIADVLKFNHIKFGIALLQQTDTEVIKQFKDIVDHVLIFSGNLGYFGGNADMGLIEKVKEIKSLNPKIEIGWDGGINLSNAKFLANNSVDVLDVGSYIHKSSDPKQAYILLVESLELNK
jgi:ribulose-phosphate 3-epimerase